MNNLVKVSHLAQKLTRVSSHGRTIDFECID